jgi:hypothetical protein
VGNVVIDMSMSLNGYIAAPNDTPEQGLGEDGMRLHNWAFDDPSVFELVYGDLTESTGAVIMDRRMYDNSIENWGGKGTARRRPVLRGHPQAHRGGRPRSSRSSPTGSRVPSRRPRRPPVRSGSGSWARTSTSSSSPPGSWTRSGPPGRCPARRRPSLVRPATRADRTGADGLSKTGGVAHLEYRVAR